MGVGFCVGFELVFCLFCFLTMFYLVILRMSRPHAHTHSRGGRAIGLDAVGKLLLWWGCCGVRRGACDEDGVDLIGVVCCCVCWDLCWV